MYFRSLQVVNFINVFTHSFYDLRSQKRKKLLKLTVFLAISVSACAKAARKMLVKLTRGTQYRRSQPYRTLSYRIFRIQFSPLLLLTHSSPICSARQFSNFLCFIVLCWNISWRINELDALFFVSVSFFNLKSE